RRRDPGRRRRGRGGDMGRGAGARTVAAEPATSAAGGAAAGRQWHPAGKLEGPYATLTAAWSRPSAAASESAEARTPLSVDDDSLRNGSTVTISARLATV